MASKLRHRTVAVCTASHTCGSAGRRKAYLVGGIYETRRRCYGRDGRGKELGSLLDSREHAAEQPQATERDAGRASRASLWEQARAVRGLRCLRRDDFRAFRVRRTEIVFHPKRVRTNSGRRD